MYGDAHYARGRGGGVRGGGASTEEACPLAAPLSPGPPSQCARVRGALPDEPSAASGARGAVDARVGERRGAHALELGRADYCTQRSRQWRARRQVRLRGGRRRSRAGVGGRSGRGRPGAWGPRGCGTVRYTPNQIARKGLNLSRS